MLGVSAAILDNIFKTSTPFIDTVINETLWEFCSAEPKKHVSALMQFQTRNENVQMRLVN